MPPSFDTLTPHQHTRSQFFEIPLGYKHQLAAQTIQKMLRGFLARKFVKSALKRPNKYKRANAADLSSKQNAARAYQDYLQLRSGNSTPQKPATAGSQPYNKIRVSKKLLQKYSSQIEQVQRTSASQLSMHDLSDHISNSNMKQDFNYYMSQKNLNFQEISRPLTASLMDRVIHTEQDFYPKKAPAKGGDQSRQDKFKTDFTLSIFDNSRKLQNRQNEIAERHKKNLEQFRTRDGFNSLMSAKQILNFSPKSSKLKQPLVFEFDLYIRAALEIQRHYRGYFSRKLNGGSFQRLKNKVILIQRAVRHFLQRRSDENAKYLQYLDQKSKKILLDMKNFYKIYRKVIKDDTKIHSKAQKQALMIKLDFEKGERIIKSKAKVTSSAADKDAIIESLNVEINALKRIIGNSSQKSARRV